MSIPTNIHEALRVGDVLKDTYEVIAQLGEGGFGVLFVGQHVKLSKRVAIKVLQRATDEKERQRFIQEARAASQIDSHPNIVTIHDYDVLESGEPYIVMELLQGHDLEQELTTWGPMARDRALRLFYDALGGLAMAHRSGIVHKDLKPSNLFLKHAQTPQERMCLLDFGIARVAQPQQQPQLPEGGRGPAPLTTTGQPIGTPQYMAPEYIADQSAVSPAVDVYQMGLILAEALSGQRAVNEPSWYTCVYKHMHHELEIPDALLDDPSLGPILKRATAFSPEERYPNAAEFRSDIGVLLGRTSGSHALAVTPPLENRGQAQPTPAAPPHTPSPSSAQRFGSDAPLPSSAPPRERARQATIAEPRSAPQPLQPPQAAPQAPTGASNGRLIAAIAVGAALTFAISAFIGWKFFSGGAESASDGEPSEPTASARVEVEEPAPAVEEPEQAPSVLQPGAMVEIPGGSFKRGSRHKSDELPIKTITLDTYKIDAYETTVADYRACVEAGSCSKPSTFSACNWGRSDRDDHPVNCINYIQARSYCEWRGKRLPTEAEWERAARGAEGRTYPWGEQEPTCDLAVMSPSKAQTGCGRNSTWPIGSKPDGATPEGAQDMAGNVFEWVEDWYSRAYVTTSDTNPLGVAGSGERVIRGGSWGHLNYDLLRSSSRDHKRQSFRSFKIGVRCASSTL